METKQIAGVYDRSEQVSLFRSVYMWVAMALAITGLSALFVSDSFGMQALLFGSPVRLIVTVVIELALVMYLTARIRTLSFTAATMLFILYSVMNGFVLSSVLLVYTATSVASTFFITAGTFASMCLIGYVTKRDLSSWGNLLMMFVLGLIIATLVNLFLHSTLLEWIISFVGIIVFSGLAAYDSQKIRQLLLTDGLEVNDSVRKIALLGALSLYLDFINLFLYFMRIFGDRD